MLIAAAYPKFRSKIFHSGSKRILTLWPVITVLDTDDRKLVQLTVSED
jgi:hypothetical protein